MASASSSNNLVECPLHARIKDKLNQEGIKLWLEPFYNKEQDRVNDAEIVALAARYSTELELSEEEVTMGVYAFQRNAIERLAERQTFQTTGLATIRLRYSGFKEGKGKLENVKSRLQIPLNETTGKELKEKIAGNVGVPVNGLKLIAAGKVVDEGKNLESQNVKNGSQIMVLSVAADHESLQEVEDQFKELEETKNSADFLASKDGTDGPYSLQVTDQTGRSLNLPDSEKKALTVGLALHEKGRGFMKNQHFSKALVFLLEADTFYNRCNSTILEMVDNFGLLHLDIAWCYLCLQSISELPQVENRLKMCEKFLLRSYGADMERVIALKGSSGWEAALYVRLHLLQGITSYHLGHIERARFNLSQAESELNRLKVSDDSLVALISMGYGAEEARLALRSTYGDIDSAVEWIIIKREETKQVKDQEREDLKRRKLQKRLGKCINGDPVDVVMYRQLKEMGYGPYLISEALKRTNNDVSASVQLMSDYNYEREVLTSIVNKLTNEPSTSLQNHPPAVASAVANVNELIASMPEADQQAGSRANIANALASNPELASTALNTFRTALNQSFSEEALLKLVPTISDEEMEKSQKAYDTLAKDIHSEAEYIDLAMEDESRYLEQYKRMLPSV